MGWGGPQTSVPGEAPRRALGGAQCGGDLITQQICGSPKVLEKAGTVSPKELFTWKLLKATDSEWIVNMNPEK